MEKKVRWRESLKMKIFLYNILIFICGITAFSIIAAKGFTNAILKSEKESTARELSLINNNLDTMLSDTEDYLRIAASDKELQQIIIKYNGQENKELQRQKTSYELSKVVSNIISPNTKIAGGAVLADGEVLFSGYSITQENVRKVLDEEYLEEIKKNQKATWGGLKLLHYSDNREEYVFPVSKLIMDKETGERLGILVLFLREKNIRQIYEKSGGDVEKRYVIVDEEGMIVSCFDDKYLDQNIEEVLPVDLKYYEELKENTQVLNEKASALYTKGIYPKFNWSVLSNTDLTLFLEEKRHNLATNILLLMGIACVVFICSFLISHTITKPLYALLGVMNRISDGDMELRAEKYNGEVGILAVGFNKLMDRLQGAMHQIYTEQRLKRKIGLQLLQSQIQPHFLYNTMETISSFVKLDYKEKALAAIRNISQFYRISLSSGKEIIEIREELKIVESYLEIQCLRYADRLQYEIEVEEGLMQCPIPKLMLQPLVENAIYHGIKQSSEPGIIIIRGYEEDDLVHLEVFDTGAGMTQERIQELQDNLEHGTSDSFGMYSVNERIKLFYGESYGIRLESIEGEYTQITVVIPKAQR